MNRFNINKLSERTRIMHETQAKWIYKNWKKTLKEHNSEIEELLEKIELFNIWRNRLNNTLVLKTLMREMYMDAYISIHFSCFGLYKFAYMCLRSEFETALRLIYFSDHRIEFEWWQNGDEKWIRELLKGTDVYGQDFKYLGFLEKIKKFEQNCTQDERLLGKQGKVKDIYKKLSKYVHSVAPYFQTRLDRFSPKYNQEEFEKWHNSYKEIQQYINIFLALSFPDIFKKMPSEESIRILNTGIESTYKIKVKEVLEL